MNNSNMTSSKAPGLAAFIGKKLFGKKKPIPKVKQNPEDIADKGKDDATENSNGTPKKPMIVPKGIAVGNPKKLGR